MKTTKSTGVWCSPSLDSFETCPDCDGLGTLEDLKHPDNWKVCNRCGGKGYISSSSSTDTQSSNI